MMSLFADNAAGISAAAILSLGSGIDRGIVDNADSDFGIKAFLVFRGGRLNCPHNLGHF